MSDSKPSDVEGSYDLVADEYVRNVYDELRHKPLDRELLDKFADQVRGAGQVCDLGCGPGQIARYLHERNVDVCGVDLSAAMVERAGRLNPGIAFTVGDMRRLSVSDNSWAGIAAFYAIVNLSPDEVALAASEIQRVLRPGGLLLMSFHIGDDIRHLDEWWGHAVSIDFHFYRAEAIVEFLRQAGMQIEEIVERGPYPEVEHQSRRAYIIARKPARLIAR
jgi:ubiquinone/menaquinone biosynthesis C-methylase UbiE